MLKRLGHPGAPRRLQVHGHRNALGSFSVQVQIHTWVFLIRRSTLGKEGTQNPSAQPGCPRLHYHSSFICHARALPACVTSSFLSAEADVSLAFPL